MSACVGALLLGLSACSEHEARPAEPKSSATTTSASPPPSVPSQATEFSPEGAAAFVTHYVAVIDHASKTGDVDELGRLSDPECGGCNDYIAFYERVYAEGGWLRNRNWTAGETDLWFSSKPGAEVRARTSLRVTRGEVKTGADATASTAPASSEVVTLGLRFESGSWVVSQLVPGDVE